MYLIRQTFLVLGLSKSGKAAAEFLLTRKASVYVYDDIVGERMEQTIRALEEAGAKRLKKEELSRAHEICDVLVLSPGIPIDHAVAVAFKRAGRSVVGETELAARYLHCPLIAVTGTNGKTTTVSMIAEVLKKGGLCVEACGNIGIPMLGLCDRQLDAAVAEISSFQLETLQSLRPHVAVVLNITEDHLNRHYNMDNYVFLKGRLLRNSTEAEYAVLNYDDPTVRGFAAKTKAKVLYFSVKERVVGAYYEGGYLYFGKERIIPVSDLPLGGLHNVQNALAVIAAAKIMGIPSDTVVSALKEFKGIRHRIEKVGEIDGITYIDDSKGTNVDATLKAIETMQAPTVLLLGGKHKGYNYDKLFAWLPKSKVIHAVLYGENRFALLKSARENGFDRFTLCEEFTFAVRVAALRAERGQTVLLSPASASFDEFSSYEERGDRFIEIIDSLAEKDSGKEGTESDDGEEENVSLDEERDADEDQLFGLDSERETE